MALVIKHSRRIFVYGAGLYSFFQAYSQACVKDSTCQTEIVEVDANSKEIWIFSLSTVGTTYMLSVERNPTIRQDQNINGFASTVTAWSSDV